MDAVHDSKFLRLVGLVFLLALVALLFLERQWERPIRRKDFRPGFLCHKKGAENGASVTGIFRFCHFDPYETKGLPIRRGMARALREKKSLAHWKSFRSITLLLCQSGVPSYKKALAQADSEKKTFPRSNKRDRPAIRIGLAVAIHQREAYMPRGC
jgi:hypothetical protein